MSTTRLSHAALAKLSGLSPEKLDDFAGTWTRLAVTERRRIVRALIDLAQDNVELDYNDLFVRLLSDEDAEVRAAAVEGLWEDERASTADQLIGLARDDADQTVREAAFDGIARFAYRVALDEVAPSVAQRIRQVLVDHLDAETPTALRRRALEAAGYLSEAPIVAAIEAAYTGSDPELRASAVRAMGRSCDERWLSAILHEVESEEPEMRFEAVRAAGEMEDERSVPLLVDRLEDEDPEIRLATIEALGAIGGQRARQTLQRVRQRGDEAMREAAETALDELEMLTEPLGVRVRDVEKN